MKFIKELLESIKNMIQNVIDTINNAILNGITSISEFFKKYWWVFLIIGILLFAGAVALVVLLIKAIF
jgi:NADH:ubiquinone oxidoreductase subunit 6 (subunit J)